MPNLVDSKTTKTDLPPDRRFCCGYLLLFPLTFLVLGLGQKFMPPLRGTPLDEGVASWNAWRQEQGRERYSMENRNLSGRDLSKVDFHETNLRLSNLTGTILHQANMSDVLAFQTRLNGADLSGAMLRRARIDESELKGADLSQADAREAGFFESDLSGANLKNCDLSKADFVLANLSDAQIAGANFRGANLWGATITGWTGWESIVSIECANIKGIVGPESFRKWALANGAVEFGEFREPESNWVTIRDQCLKDLEEGEKVNVK